jgi:hypothetical protein
MCSSSPCSSSIIRWSASSTGKGAAPVLGEAHQPPLPFPACTLIPVPKLALPGMLIEVGHGVPMGGVRGHERLPLHLPP